MTSSDFKRFLDLTLIEFKLRDQGTFLGFFWTLLNPVLSFIILYVLFSGTLGASSKSFSIHLLVGLIFWNLFSTATSYGTSAVFRRAQYLRVAPVSPIAVIGAGVASVLLSSILESVIALISISILVPTIAINILGIIYYVIGLILIAFMSFSIACFLSIASIFFYDTGNLWNIVLRLGFFLTPVFYTVDSIPSGYQWLVNINPISVILSQARAGLMSDSVNINSLLVISAAIFIFVIISLFIVKSIRYKFNEI